MTLLTPSGDVSSRKESNIPSMWLESFRQGAYAVAGHPLRSSLGALAIAVAVATIVTVTTALEGVRLYAEATTARTFGSDTFVLAQVAASTRVSRRELREQLARNPAIRRADVRFLDRYAGDRRHLCPQCADPRRGRGGGAERG